MQNNFFTKTDNINKLNAVSLTALTVFLIYLFSVTLAPIANGIIKVRNNTLSISQKSNIHSYFQALKLKTNAATTINIVTYINQGQIISRQVDNNNLQSYIFDAKGSVLKLNFLDKSQDQIYSYDSYGKSIANTTKLNPVLSVLNPFQYNGERFDNNTNLQYLRARFYNPEIGRFISQDTYDLLNRFNYTDSNPVMRTDPSGHDANSFDPFTYTASSFVCSMFTFLIVNFFRGIVRDVAIKITSKTKFFIKSAKATIISVTEPITTPALRKIYEYKNYSENKEAEITLYKDRCDSCEKLLLAMQSKILAAVSSEESVLLEEKSKICKLIVDYFKWHCQAKQFLQEEDLGEMSIAHIEKKRKRIEDLNDRLAIANDMHDGILREKQQIYCATAQVR